MSEPFSAGRRRALKIGAALIAGSALSAGGWAVWNRGRNLYQIRRERTLMQTSVSINVFSSDPTAARRAIQAAFERMATVVAVLNRFDPHSAVARLNREGHLGKPPAELRTVLAHALGVSRATNGDFDVTVGPVLDYYLGLGCPVAMTPELQRAVAEREERVGYRYIAMSEEDIRFARPRMAVTLDGIAKGYVADQGMAVLRQNGIEEALIDAGGDLRAMSGSGKRHWNVGVVDPLQTARMAAVIRIDNAGVSTSGNYEVFFTADRKLFHIINPHTGYSPLRYSSVTVVARESIESDAMGVAGFFLELPRMKEVMATRDAQWLAFDWDGARRWRSKDLPLVEGQAGIA